jgi:hypothetical protein
VGKTTLVNKLQKLKTRNATLKKYGTSENVSTDGIDIEGTFILIFFSIFQIGISRLNLFEVKAKRKKK